MSGVCTLADLDGPFEYANAGEVTYQEDALSGPTDGYGSVLRNTVMGQKGYEELNDRF